MPAAVTHWPALPGTRPVHIDLATYCGEVAVLDVLVFKTWGVASIVVVEVSRTRSLLPDAILKSSQGTGTDAVEAEDAAAGDHEVGNLAALRAHHDVVDAAQLLTAGTDDRAPTN